MKTLVAKCRVYENEIFISCSISKRDFAFVSAAESDMISLSQTEIISSVCFGVFSATRISVLGFLDNHFILWDTAMIGMVAVLLYYHRAQSLLCHMPLDPLDAAGCPSVIEYMA